MTEHSKRPLDSDVLDCLRTDFVASSPDAKRRIAIRLAGSAAALGLAAASGPPVEASVSARGPRLGAGRSRSSLLARHQLAVTAVAFAMGAVCGAGIHAALDHRAAGGVTAAARSASVPAPPPNEDHVAAPIATPRTELSGEGAPVESAGTNRPRAPRPAASLAEEQALLDRARAALAQGDDGAALRALELHGHRYPNGIMTEEREALAIKALVEKGNYAAGRLRGDHFREQFPRSLLLPSIEDALRTIP